MDIRADGRSGTAEAALVGPVRSDASAGLGADESSGRSASPELTRRIADTKAVRPSIRVDQHREAIRALVAQHHAANPRLFGSVARGEDHPGSDVDVLVDFADNASLSDEVGLRLALVDLLEVDVDVVAVDSLKQPNRERILREAVPV